MTSLFSKERKGENCKSSSQAARLRPNYEEASRYPTPYPPLTTQAPPPACTAGRFRLATKSNKSSPLLFLRPSPTDCQCCGLRRPHFPDIHSCLHPVFDLSFETFVKIGQAFNRSSLPASTASSCLLPFVSTPSCRVWHSALHSPSRPKVGTT